LEAGSSECQYQDSAIQVTRRVTPTAQGICSLPAAPARPDGSQQLKGGQLSRRLFKPIHQRQSESPLLDHLAEDGFYSGCVAFTEKLKDASGIVPGVRADDDQRKLLWIVRRVETDVS
jgi:hypothetical protein